MRAACESNDLDFLQIDSILDVVNATSLSFSPIHNGRYSGVFHKTKRSKRTLTQLKESWRKKQIKVLQWNVEGLFSAPQDITFQPSDTDYDVILLQKTFRIKESSIMGFTVHEKLANKPTLGRPIGFSLR